MKCANLKKSKKKQNKTKSPQGCHVISFPMALGFYFLQALAKQFMFWLFSGRCCKYFPNTLVFVQGRSSEWLISLHAGKKSCVLGKAH